MTRENTKLKLPLSIRASVFSTRNLQMICSLPETVCDTGRPRSLPAWPFAGRVFEALGRESPSDPGNDVSVLHLSLLPVSMGIL